MADSLSTSQVISPERHSAGSESIVLPESLTEGLNDVQVGIMRDTVYAVNSNSRIAAELVRSTAAELYRLKCVLKKNQEWTRFRESGDSSDDGKPNKGPDISLGDMAQKH